MRTYPINAILTPNKEYRVRLIEKTTDEFNSDNMGKKYAYGVSAAPKIIASSTLT